jgi:hypothetical protein
MISDVVTERVRDAIPLLSKDITETCFRYDTCYIDISQGGKIPPVMNQNQTEILILTVSSDEKSIGLFLLVAVLFFFITVHMRKYFEGVVDLVGDM